MKKKIAVFFSLILLLQFLYSEEVKKIRDFEYHKLIKSGSLSNPSIGIEFNTYKLLKSKLKSGQVLKNDTKRPIYIEFEKNKKNSYGYLLSNSILTLPTTKEQKKSNVSIMVTGTIRLKINATKTYFKKGQFRVKSPTVVGGVRGTTFSLSKDIVKLPEGIVALTPVNAKGEENEKLFKEINSGNIATIKEGKIKVSTLEGIKKEWALIAPHDVYPPLMPTFLKMNRIVMNQPDPKIIVKWQGTTIKGNKVMINEFYYSKKRITVEEYNVFYAWHKLTKSHDFCHPNEPLDHTHEIKRDKLNPNLTPKNNKSPVHGVSFYDAYACANYYGGRLPYYLEGMKIREKSFKDKARSFSTLTKSFVIIEQYRSVHNLNVGGTKYSLKIDYGIGVKLENGDTKTMHGAETSSHLRYKGSIQGGPSMGFRILFDEKPPKQLKPVFKAGK
jgi:hypothetical protein